VREAAGDLAGDHGRVQDTAAVVRGDVLVDAQRAGGGINFDTAEVEDEAVAE
jgi:hypothetical protein